MNDQTELTAIRRKAGAGRTPSEGCGMTPLKAFRLALSKAAEDELQLAARVLGVTEQRLTHGPLLEALSEESLLVLLEGPQGAKGVATFDAQLLATVIEVQTTGRVTRAEAKARPPTRTDSAMCEVVLDRSLVEFEGHLAEDAAAGWATGFRFGTQVENTRLLGLLLEDISYRLFRISLDLADGAKQGELLIALPMLGAGSARPGCGAGGAESWARTLDKAVHASQAEITAVLHRLHMPLTNALSLAVGQVLELPQTALGKVSLEGADGRAVGTARLGQQQGFRALRMNGSGPAPMLAGIGDSLPAPAPEPMAEMAPMPDLAMGLPMVEPKPEPMPEGLPDLPMAPMGDGGLDDLPMAPMAAAGLDDLPMADIAMNPMAEDDTADALADMPMAAMPMDIEIG